MSNIQKLAALHLNTREVSAPHIFFSNVTTLLPFVTVITSSNILLHLRTDICDDRLEATAMVVIYISM